MKLAIISPFEEDTPPPKYGGIELMTHNLAKELVAQGVDVSVLATGSSQTAGTIVPIFEKSIRSLPTIKDKYVRVAYYFTGIGRVIDYLRENEFDVVHNNLGWGLMPFLSSISQPVVHTLHGALSAEHEHLIYSNFPQANYVSISMSQRTPLPDLHYVKNIYNGIDTSRFRFFAEPDNYFVFLARMSPEKGALQAIQIARAAGVRLIMAAKVDPVDEHFFKNTVLPHIDGDQIQFVGEVNQDQKIELLGHAQALLAPIQWDEPFGFYFIEAMACGTPVIAFKRGSTTEIIEDTKTGFLCNSMGEIVHAVKNASSIDRQDCFNAIHGEGSPFSAQYMSKEYLELFQSMID